MSMPHNFSDDPKAFGGPPPPTDNTKTVLIVVAVILGVVVLMCGGMITAGVFIARQATQEFEQVFEQMQAEMESGQQQMEEYQTALASGDYGTAIQAMDERLASVPDDASAHNNKAWLLATCPDAEFRDGKLAVEHATKACELTGWTFGSFIDTLAAAHAESGDFEAAAEWQQKAIDTDSDEMFSNEFAQRLALYQSGQPYREGPQGKMPSELHDDISTEPDAGVEAVESVFGSEIETETSQEQGSP